MVGSGFQNFIGSGSGFNIKVLNPSKIELFSSIIDQTDTDIVSKYQLYWLLCRKKVKVEFY